MSVYSDYLDDLKAALDAIDHAQLQAVEDVLVKAFEDDMTVFAAGNGGSAATASHMACDFLKTTLGKCPSDAGRRLRCVALTDSMPIVTAYANDTSYEHVFAEPLRSLAHTGDVLMAISASGNSPNILRALAMARNIGMVSIAFLGFGGGKAVEMADHAVLIDSDNYGIVEDAHSILMHMFTARMAEVVQGAQNQPG